MIIKKQWEEQVTRIFLVMVMYWKIDGGYWEFIYQVVYKAIALIELFNVKEKIKWPVWKEFWDIPSRIIISLIVQLLFTLKDLYCKVHEVISNNLCQRSNTGLPSAKHVPSLLCCLSGLQNREFYHQKFCMAHDTYYLIKYFWGRSYLKKTFASLFL